MKALHFYSIFLMVCFTMVNCQHNYETTTRIEPPASAMTVKIDALMNAFVHNKDFNGNLLIMKGDSVIYNSSFGMANRAFEIQNSASTKFLIGSITKPFTAMGILILVDKKLIALNDPLSKFLPDFPKADNVSIKQLLMHRAGLKDYHVNKNWKADGQRDTSPLETLESLGDNPYDFEPGTKFRYSNCGYILLGLIIEKVSGTTFEKFIENEILVPLNLNNTGIVNNENIVTNLAEGYVTDLKNIKQASYVNYRQPFSSGNMYSTTADLWGFTKAVINGKLISKELTEEIFNESEQYGYGWGIRFFNEQRAYGHFGGMNGFVGSINYIPEGEYFICFLTNDDNTPKYTIVSNLVDLIMGRTVAHPQEKNLIELKEEVIDKTVGNYLIKEADTLKVFEFEGSLYMQETGQEKQEMFPIGEQEYTFTLLEFNVLFKELKHGVYQQLEFTGIVNLQAKRV